MAGAWEGPADEGETLQETWLPPAAGTMAAVVRLMKGGETIFLELIAIEEAEGTLVFRIQQWRQNLEPLMPTPQKLVLAEIGERRVQFVPDEPGGVFRALTYSRPAADAFNIEVNLAEPPMRYQVALKPR